MATLPALTQLERDILRSLEDEGPATLNQLARAVQSGGFHTRRAGLVLYNAGLVTLRRGADARVYHLTAAGREYVGRLQQPARRASR